MDSNWPAPGFAVLLPPPGLANAAQEYDKNEHHSFRSYLGHIFVSRSVNTLRRLRDASFIDGHTRSILFDVNVYSVSLSDTS